MGGKITWHGKDALKTIQARLVRATIKASAEGADRAREIAPLGQARGRATGTKPRFFSLRLQTLREFDREHPKARRGREGREARLRLQELRHLNRRELIEAVTPRTIGKDIEFFRFAGGSHKGEQPDIVEERPAKGPGGLALRGARTTYKPGRLRAGIHPIDVEISGQRVIGGYASEAPYSNVVEKGFHHKGGTQVEGKHFMRKSAEAMRARWNSGQFFEE